MAGGEESVPPAKPKFALVLRGYDPSDVVAHLEQVNAELRRLGAERDEGVSQAYQLAERLEAARRETDQLQAQVSRMAATRGTAEGTIERVQWTLQVYRDEEQEIWAGAEAEAEATKAPVLAEAAELAERGRRQPAELDAEYHRVREEMASHRSAVLAELDRQGRDADERRAALDAQAQARRAETEEDFAIRWSCRRADADAEFAKLEAHARAEADRVGDEAKAEADRLIAEASDTARRIVDEARAALATQVEQRDRLTERVQSAREELDRAVASLGESGEEAAFDSRHENAHLNAPG